MQEQLRAEARLPRDRARQRGGGAFLLRWLGRLVGLVGGLIVLAGIGAAIAGYGAYRHYAADLPDVEGLRHYQPRVMSRVYAGDGRLMAELATERRIFVPYTAIPELVKQAFVSAEDQNFWRHRGVDPIAIARAAVTDLSHMGEGRRPIGASTITQQVAKNMLLGNELSLARKVKEAILALRIEQSLSKERILELYLNEIYLGEGSYGVAAAAAAYFDKSLDALTLPEAAFLAALPKAPNNYNPARFPEAARGRRDWVLDRMAEDHDITVAQAEAAKATPIPLPVARRLEPVAGSGFFAEEVRRRLIEQFGAEATTQGGLAVRTSLDPRLQLAAEQALRGGLMAYDRAHGGWRGALTTLDLGADPAHAEARADWVGRLGQLTPPPGMPASWRLAIVLDMTDAEARLGVLDRAGGPPVPRILPLYLAEHDWARPVHDGVPGAAPRRMADILHPGDVVMVEPQPAQPARGKVPARPDRLALRQIPLVEGALVSLDPRTGRVLAMAGGWSFETSQFNRATQANRQPGSSFKPIVYLTAMEQGISPSQRFLDAPLVVDMGAAGKWRPNNYEMEFSGLVPLHVALEKSLNLVTLHLADHIGMAPIADNAVAFHVVDSMPKVLPAAIGAIDTTVLRMAGAYASLAAGGREVVPHLIDSVQDRDGHVIWRPDGFNCESCAGDAEHGPLVDDDRHAIADPASVFQVVTMMQGVVRRGTGVAAGAGFDRPIAGKTGTTQDFNDAWFGGFTPDLVTMVWVGFDNPTSLGEKETGGVLAAPIWHDFMTVALKDHPVLQFISPPGVTLASWDSGFGVVVDAFKDGQVPGSSTAAPAAGAGVAGGGGGHPAPTSSSAGGLDSSMGGLY